MTSSQPFRRFAFAHGPAVAVLYVVAVKQDLALITVFPTLGIFVLGTQHAEDAAPAMSLPAMYWYGWTATAALGALVPGLVAGLLPEQWTRRISGGWLWVIPAFAMIACVYLTLPWFRLLPGLGQDFVRVYAEQTYGIAPEQVVGTAGQTKYGYDKNGRPFLTKEPKLLLNDNNAGKPEGIHLMIGRRPYAAFGNSTGDRQMLEYTQAGDGARLMMLVLHDDATCEYAYGPAQGLPGTKVGTFTQALYDQAMKKGWTVISMKNDWKRIFVFEQ